MALHGGRPESMPSVSALSPRLRLILCVRPAARTTVTTADDSLPPVMPEPPRPVVSTLPGAAAPVTQVQIGV